MSMLKALYKRKCLAVLLLLIIENVIQNFPIYCFSILILKLQWFYSDFSSLDFRS